MENHNLSLWSMTNQIHMWYIIRGFFSVLLVCCNIFCNLVSRREGERVPGTHTSLIRNFVVTVFICIRTYIGDAMDSLH